VLWPGYGERRASGKQDNVHDRGGMKCVRL